MNVLVHPAERGFEAAGGATLLAAAQAAGWRWPSVCGGMAECGTCAFEVEDGADLLTSIGAREQARLELLPQRRARPDKDWRLACQARVTATGSLALRKPGARPDPATGAAIADQGVAAGQPAGVEKSPPTFKLTETAITMPEQATYQLPSPAAEG